jgi:glycosyltransferase involved in cell wall biosynthesis
LVKKIFKQVDRFLPVTNNLDTQVKKLVGPVTSTIIPNVVDTEIFYYREPSTPGNKFRFVHVSTMVYQKNPEGLLRAFKAFNNIHPGAILTLVGPYPVDVLHYARSLGYFVNFFYSFYFLKKEHAVQLSQYWRISKDDIQWVKAFLR